MEDKFYTPDEIAKLLKVSRATVINLIKNGKIKAINIGLGKQRNNWRIFEGQYLNFLAESYE